MGVECIYSSLGGGDQLSQRRQAAGVPAGEKHHT